MIFSKDFYSIQESCKLLEKAFDTTFTEKDIIDFYLSEYIRFIIQVKDLNEESVVFYYSKKDIHSIIKNNYFIDIKDTYFSIIGDERNLLYVMPYQHSGSGYFYLFREALSISNDFLVVRAIKVLSEKSLDINPLVSIDKSGGGIEKPFDIRKTENGVIVYFNDELLINKDEVLISERDILNLVEVIKNKQNKFNNYIHSEYSDQAHKDQTTLAEELKELKSKLEEKDKKIDELQTALNKMDYPIQLNKFMENDRLALAIQARKDYWANYDPNLNNAPKAEATAKELREKYNLSDNQAKAIEIVACPINRN